MPPAIFEKGIGQWRISEETSSRPDTNRVQRSPSAVAFHRSTAEEAVPHVAPGAVAFGARRWQRMVRNCRRSPGFPATLRNRWPEARWTSSCVASNCDRAESANFRSLSRWGRVLKTERLDTKLLTRVLALRNFKRLDTPGFSDSAPRSARSSSRPCFRSPQPLLERTEVEASLDCGSSSASRDALSGISERTRGRCWQQPGPYANTQCQLRGVSRASPGDCA